MPVVGIILDRARSGPDDRGHAHSLADRADTVINITIGRTHGVGRDTSDLTDGLTGPAKFGDDLIVGEGSEVGVRPRVSGELMAGHVFCLQDRGAGDCPGTDDEERRLEGVGVEIVEQIGSIRGWSIVVTQSPSQLIRASRDIRRPRALSARPPAPTRISNSSSIRRVRASSNTRWGIVGNRDTRVCDLLDPRLDLGCGGIGNQVEGGE